MSHKRDKNKVLLVDDEPDFLEIMGEAIGAWGYDVVTASNGDEAIKRLAEQNPDVIILDYVLQDIDGVTLLKKMRHLDRDIPVILFTARPDTDAIKDSEGLSSTAFIPKLSPYVDTKKALKSALSMALKKADK